MTNAQREPIVVGTDFLTDPHRQYTELRDEGPVVRVVTPLGTLAWMVTRHADVRAALTDPRLYKDRRRYLELLGPAGRPPGALDRHMLNADPPDHTRLRRLVGKAFTARAIAALRPRIEAIAAELLDTMADGPDEIDLLDAFAYPLPITVICELLGVPVDDRDDFRRWSNALLQARTEQTQVAAIGAMAEYLTRLVDTKLRAPADDMLSAIVQATEDADRLSRGEAVSMAFLLLVAGHETTANLIGNGTLALLCSPDQLAALRADLGLVPNAVEEFLRYDGPVNLTPFRYTAEPVRIGAVDIPAGEVVLVSLLSANRDPDRYEEAERLDVRRESSHLAFGHGIHHCLGAPLARLEAEVAFTALLDRFPRLTLADESLSWVHSTLIRGLDRLPVRLGYQGDAPTHPPSG